MPRPAPMLPPVSLDLEAEFPVLGEVDFLNHAAVAPMSGRAAKAMRDAADACTQRSYLTPGWYGDVLRVKPTAATLLNARGPHEIAFIPNTTTGLAMLAGGLDATNVAEAVRLTGAKQVDVASGVERAPGIKDAARIAEFVVAAKV